MDVKQAIETKSAVREYASRALTDEVVCEILRAGRRAQSARNTQPWHFVAVRERNALRALERCGPSIEFVSQSGMTVALLTPPPSQSETILFDAGQAAAYMQLRAWELGVASCLGSIFEQQPARSLLGFPEDLYIRIIIAFGYPTMDAAHARRTKVMRRSLDEIVHWETW